MMEKKTFLKFKRGKQTLLLNKAIKKAGSEKKLTNLTKIPSASIYSYKNEIHPLPLERAKKLATFLRLGFKEIKKQVKQIDYKGFAYRWKKEKVISTFKSFANKHRKNSNLPRMRKNISRNDVIYS